MKPGHVVPARHVPGKCVMNDKDRAPIVGAQTFIVSITPA